MWNCTIPTVAKQVIIFWSVSYTIEFQKRDLPHAHILFFIKPKYKNPPASKIDEIVSTKIPDKETDPVAFAPIENHMIHGPCGDVNKNSPCMEKGKCKKHFPKKFFNQTSVDNDRYLMYRQRNNGAFVEKKGIKLDNYFAVPYNRNLLVKFDAHINIEICNQHRSIKYLFKYVNKGSDIMIVSMKIENNSQQNNQYKILQEKDEIKAYLDCKYV